MRKQSFHSILRSCAAFAIILICGITASAEELYDNGDTDGTATLGWGQYSSTMDDFYVPGAGWYLDGASTIGIYLNAADVVADVQVVIYEHDPVTNGPDLNSAMNMTGESFETVETGRQFFGGYDEIEINVDFNEVFLEGQEFYWIEFIVTNQFGTEDFRFLARQNITHEQAWVMIGNSAYPSEDAVEDDVDLAFRLYGGDIEMNELLPQFDPELTDGFDNGYEGPTRQPIGGLKQPTAELVLPMYKMVLPTTRR